MLLHPLKLEGEQEELYEEQDARLKRMAWVRRCSVLQCRAWANADLLSVPMQETQQHAALETSAHKPWYLLDPEVCLQVGCAHQWNLFHAVCCVQGLPRRLWDFLAAMLVSLSGADSAAAALTAELRRAADLLPAHLCALAHCLLHRALLVRFHLLLYSQSALWALPLYDVQGNKQPAAVRRSAVTAGVRVQCIPVLDVSVLPPGGAGAGS